LYESHFQLQARPFDETVDPSFHVELASRVPTLRRLRYALEYGPGVAVLAGGPGVGKSMACRVVAAELAWPATVAIVPAFPADSLPAALCAELGDTPSPGEPHGVTVTRLRRRLAAEADADRRTLLIVEEPPDPAWLTSLRLLLNLSSRGRPALALLLAGDAHCFDALPPALADRAGAPAWLPPLAHDEIRPYLEGRLRTVGATGPPLFPPDLVRALHAASAGSPRRLNRLADLSLLVAFARDLERPDLECVASAVDEAGLDPLALAS
jgi:type II secretory pathway predicted ATPase ExeA